MTTKQKIKLSVLMAIVSYITQFVMLRPGEGIGVVLVLGTASLVASLAFLALCEWISKP